MFAQKERVWMKMGTVSDVQTRIARYVRNIMPRFVLSVSLDML